MNSWDHDNPWVEYLAAFGRIAIELSYTEALMRDCISKLTGIKDHRLLICLTGSDKYNDTRDKLDQLLKYMLGTPRKRLPVEFKTILTTLEKLNIRRNEILHSTDWNLHSEPTSEGKLRTIIYRAKSLRKLNQFDQFVETEPLDMDELNTLINDIGKARLALKTLVLDDANIIREKYHEKLARFAGGDRGIFERKKTRPSNKAK